MAKKAKRYALGEGIQPTQGQLDTWAARNAEKRKAAAIRNEESRKRTAASKRASAKTARTSTQAQRRATRSPGGFAGGGTIGVDSHGEYTIARGSGAARPQKFRKDG